MEGRTNAIEFKAILQHWLSRYVLPSGLEDSLNSSVFPLKILLAKEKRLALASFYLGSLFFRLEECVKNIVQSVGHYHGVIMLTPLLFKSFY